MVNLTKPFGCAGLELYELTDAATPTYADAVDVPCIQSVTFGREIANAKLRGDDSVCDVIAVNKNLTFEFTSGGVALDIWAILLNEADPTDYGTGDNEATYLDLTDSPTTREFGWIAQATNSSGGDTHLQMFRCTSLEGPDPEFADESHATSTFSGEGIQSPHGGSIFLRIMNHKTATPIPTAWPAETAYTST